MIRVLHIVGTMNKGGMETYLMNMFRAIDRSKIIFDFIVHSDEKQDYEDEIVSLGGKLHRVANRHESIIKNFNEIKTVVKSNNYQIVERHMSSSIFMLDLKAAHYGGAKILLSHSHSSLAKSRTQKILNIVMRPYLYSIADVHLACSNLAGKWLYGNRAFEIINNGIDLNSFTYLDSVRRAKRTEMGINDKFVVVHVGRLAKVKNHTKLLKVFKEIKKEKTNAVLLIIGVGDLKKSIEDFAEKLGILNSIRLLGSRNDVNQILQASDVFIMPSFFEGLPVSAIEAQATGIKCYLSDTISPDTKVSDNLEFISIEDSDYDWAQKVLEKSHEERTSRSYECRVSGYDNNMVAKELENLYLNLYKTIK